MEGLYKAGRVECCSKHFLLSQFERQSELLTDRLVLSANHLSESEMATFVSVSFPSPQCLSAALLCFDY